MSHGPTKIPSRGECIYCGATGIALTDEHVVPLSLGGQHILLGASCKACAAVTSKFELDVARRLWGDARASYNAPSRRKKKRPSHITIPPARAGAYSLTVPVSEYPAAMVFYKMDKAGILRGSAEDVDHSANWTLIAITDQSRIRAFEMQHPGQLTAKFTHVPASFARLLAKIGYCQVLTGLDPQDFTPIILPYILGSKTNLSYLVGGDSTLRPPLPGTGYSLNTIVVGTEVRSLLIAVIRLFASNQTPDYHVVVGEVVGAAQVAHVNAKLGIVAPAPGAVVVPGGLVDMVHWFPNGWRP